MLVSLHSHQPQLAPSAKRWSGTRYGVAGAEGAFACSQPGLLRPRQLANPPLAATLQVVLAALAVAARAPTSAAEVTAIARALEEGRYVGEEAAKRVTVDIPRLRPSTTGRPAALAGRAQEMPGVLGAQAAHEGVRRQAELSETRRSSVRRLAPIDRAAVAMSLRPGGRQSLRSSSTRLIASSARAAVRSHENPIWRWPSQPKRSMRAAAATWPSTTLMKVVVTPTRGAARSVATTKTAPKRPPR